MWDPRILRCRRVSNSYISNSFLFIDAVLIMVAVVVVLLFIVAAQEITAQTTPAQSVDYSDCRDGIRRHKFCISNGDSRSGPSLVCQLAATTAQHMGCCASALDLLLAVLCHRGAV